MKKEFILCLGIESTAHTFSVAVVRKKLKSTDFEGWEFLSNAKDAFVTEKGGMIPAQVSDHHMAVCATVLKNALDAANVAMQDIDLVAFSQGPGLGGSLRIGAAMARSLALQNSLPLVGVNHCVAHLEIGRILSGFDDPILLYASGANTQIIAYEQGVYRVFGETLDIGVGNFLDTIGRVMGLGFPAGPKIESLAKNGTFYDLPYRVKGMDVSFAGLVTRIKTDYAAGISKEDICFSVQETVFAMLTEVAERALSHTNKTQLVLGGGVACNKRLQSMCVSMAAERGAVSFAPPAMFLVDNAAMIAATGILMHQRGVYTNIENSVILPNQRTDDIAVTWR